MVPKRPPRKRPECVAFGKAVRELRERQGDTLESFAEKAGLHWTYVGGIERGVRNPTLGVIVKLAKGLGVSPARLFES